MSQLEQSPQVSRPRAHRQGRALAAGAVALVLALGAVACGDDDGADVRSSGPGASEAASGTGSASGTDSASGSGVAGECEAVDGTLGVDDADSTVAVTLDEFSITAEPNAAAAGAIGFVTENAGEEAHELVLAQAAPEDIVVVDGAPDEEALGDALVGEIEAFAAGETCEGTFELEAGDYVLFCALVETKDDGTVESHYAEGMVTTFTVG